MMDTGLVVPRVLKELNSPIVTRPATDNTVIVPGFHFFDNLVYHVSRL